jgi:hypothetical protein
MNDLIKTAYGYMLTTEQGFFELDGANHARFSQNLGLSPEELVIHTDKGLFFFWVTDGVPKCTRVSLFPSQPIPDEE